MLGFASDSICYWDCLVWVLLPKCVYHFRMQDLEKSVVLPELTFLMAEETNLVLPCFDKMAGSCFWAAFFLPCDKSHQFLLVIFNFWEEEHSLFFLLGGDFYSHSTISKNSLFSDLAQTAPMTGRGLSPQHDSQPPGHPAKADLSFMSVLGLVLKWRLRT